MIYINEKGYMIMTEWENKLLNESINQAANE